MNNYRKILIIILFCLYAVMASAQQHLLTGRIIAADDKLPVEDATISLKYTHTNTTSKKGGIFSIIMQHDADTLLVSHLNYRVEKIAVNKSSAASVLLVILYKSDNALQDVIVSTGFERLPKERATGSFDFLSNKTINLQTGRSILDRLNGVTSGVLFDDSKINSVTKQLNFSIRGLSTINGNKDPLIIVDNFPYDGDLNNINPNDVENITILKDAAAASIWGSKAGNGVIIITTKRGRLNQPMQVEVNSNIIVSPKPDLFYLPQMASSDYIAVEKTLFDAGFYDNYLSDPSMPALSPAVEIFLQQQNGSISQAEADKQLGALNNADIRNDYNKYFYQPSVNQQYALNLRGGNNKMTYYISGGYDRNIGNLHDKNNRLNVTMQSTYNPLKNLQVSVGATYTNTTTQSGKPAYGDITISQRPIPYLSFADDEGNPLPVAINYRAGYTDTAGAGKLLNWKYYPLEDYKHSISNGSLRNLNTNINAQYNIGDALSINVLYNYQRQEQTTKTLNDNDSYAARNIINLFTQIDPVTGIVNNIVPDGGILNTVNTTIESNNARGQLNFSKTWGNNFISAIAGVDLRQTKTDFSSYAVYGFNSNLLIAGASDFKNAYPTFVNGYTSFLPDGVAFTETLNRFVSTFANASYTYKNRYTLSGSMRKDASNLFGVSTNNKWNPFWSAGAAWDISKEKFYTSSFIPSLKVRITYGSSGNVDQTKSAVTVLTYLGTFDYTNLPFAQVTQFANPELQWEEVKTLNAAIDFATKNQILLGSIEFYKKNGTNLFGPSPIDYTIGTFSNVMTKNIADMKTNGVDINLQSTNLDKKIKWTSNLLFSYTVSKTTKYYVAPGQKFQPGFGQDVSPVTGKPLYSILSYRWGGLDPATGDPRGYLNKDLSTDYFGIFNSLTSPDSLAFNGSATPEFYGSLGNTISWKGFALSINISFKFDYYFRKSSIDYSNLYDNGIGNSDYANRWQKPGDEKFTNVPSMVFPANTRRDKFYLLSTATVYKADNIRLQFINLSYDLKTGAKKNALNIQLYSNASNIGILWKANKLGLDPDYPSTLKPLPAYTIGFKLLL